MEKIKKTNVMRLLEKECIAYTVVTYPVDENDLSGEHVAKALGQDPRDVYKTLVAHGDKTGYLVACIPVAESIDLKALARVSGNKRVEMLQMKALLPVTGYIRGGCSPIGMKKKFPTYVEEAALERDKLYVSAGMRGMQVCLSPSDLIRAAQATLASILAQP